MLRPDNTTYVITLLYWELNFEQVWQCLCIFFTVTAYTWLFQGPAFSTSLSFGQKPHAPTLTTALNEQQPPCPPTPILPIFFTSLVSVSLPTPLHHPILDLQPPLSTVHLIYSRQYWFSVSKIKKAMNFNAFCAPPPTHLLYPPWFSSLPIPLFTLYLLPRSFLGVG